VPAIISDFSQECTPVLRSTTHHRQGKILRSPTRCVIVYRDVHVRKSSQLPEARGAS